MIIESTSFYSIYEGEPPLFMYVDIEDSEGEEIYDTFLYELNDWRLLETDEEYRRTIIVL